MISADDISQRRAAIEAHPELAALRDRLVARAQPVLERMPHVPDVKAALTRDGGTCPADGAALVFDPWSPFSHRCPQCGAVASGERHHAHWARAQHLWIAEHGPARSEPRDPRRVRARAAGRDAPVDRRLERTHRAVTCGT